MEANYVIRRLHPRTDHQLFEQMYGWLLSAPHWRRDTEAVFGTLDREEYLLAAYSPNRIDIGVFDHGELCADIILTLQGSGIYEAHLEARRGAPLDLLAVCISQVRDQMFAEYGAQMFFTWQPVRNRTVIAMQKSVGFHADHVNMLRGVSHGKAIEWTRLSLRRN